MNKFAESLGYIIVGIALLVFVAVIGGTVLWLVWEDSITAMFPTAIENGVLAENLTWWQSVKIVWVFATLFGSMKSGSSNSK